MKTKRTKTAVLTFILLTITLSFFQNCSSGFSTNGGSPSSEQNTTSAGTNINNTETAVTLTNPQMTFLSQESLYKNRLPTSYNTSAIMIDGSNWVVGSSYNLSVSKDSGLTWHNFTLKDGVPSMFVSAVTKYNSTITIVSHLHGLSLLKNYNEIIPVTESANSGASFHTMGTFPAVSPVVIANCAYLNTPSYAVEKICFDAANNYTYSINTSTDLLSKLLTANSCNIGSSSPLLSYLGNLVYPCNSTSVLMSSDGASSFSLQSIPTEFSSYTMNGNLFIGVPKVNSGCSLVYSTEPLSNNHFQCVPVAAELGVASSVGRVDQGFEVQFPQGHAFLFPDLSMKYLNGSSIPPKMRLAGLASLHGQNPVYFTQFGFAEVAANNTFTRTSASSYAPLGAYDVLHSASGGYVFSNALGIRSTSDSFAPALDFYPKYDGSNYTQTDVANYVDLSNASFSVSSMTQLSDQIYLSISGGTTYDANTLKINNTGFLGRLMLDSQKFVNGSIYSFNFDFKSMFKDGDYTVGLLSASRSVVRFKTSDLADPSLPLSYNAILLQPWTTISEYISGRSTILNDVDGNHYLLWSIFSFSTLNYVNSIYKWDSNLHNFTLLKTVSTSQRYSTGASPEAATDNAVIFQGKIFPYNQASVSLKVIDLTTNPIAERPLTSAELTQYCGDKTNFDFIARSENSIHFACSTNQTNPRFTAISASGTNFVLQTNWSSDPLSGGTYRVMETPQGYIYATGSGLLLISN